MDCRNLQIKNAELTEMCTKCQLLSLVIMSKTSLALELLMLQYYVFLSHMMPSWQNVQFFETEIL